MMVVAVLAKMVLVDSVIAVGLGVSVGLGEVVDTGVEMATGAQAERRIEIKSRHPKICFTENLLRINFANIFTPNRCYFGGFILDFHIKIEKQIVGKQHQLKDRTGAPK